jgi:predicted ATPase
LSHEHEVGVKWNTTRGWRPSQRLHARIAQVLEERPTEAGEAGPEVLAQHLTNAGLAARAIPYWRRAGELAARRSANLEAVAHLSKGLDSDRRSADGNQGLPGSGG